MKILVSGSSGLVGSALLPFLSGHGHTLGRLVRSEAALGEDGVLWDPDSNRIDEAGLEGADAVIHLAGRNIAAGRWTAKQKRLIRDSRVVGTRLLCEALSRLGRPPQTLIAASAVGYYGSRGDEILTEGSVPGGDFLAEICEEWEQTTEIAQSKGIRVVKLRLGVVLSTHGGALSNMLTPFRLGLGGVIGNGNQYWSWIAMDDVLGAILHCLETESLEGPVNCVSPQPATNREFTKALGKVLSRPTIFPLPGFLARIILGEMADALLLSSTRVEPRRLVETGYDFRHPELEDALRHILGKDG